MEKRKPTTPDADKTLYRELKKKEEKTGSLPKSTVSSSATGYRTSDRECAVPTSEKCNRGFKQNWV